MGFFERKIGMNILLIGDIVGTQGCDFLRSVLPGFKKLKAIDVVIANGENAAPGNGITSSAAEHIFSSGVDFITTGNHAFRRSEVYHFLDERGDIIRPANVGAACPGKGFGVIDMGRVRIGVINLLGRAYINGSDNPFSCIDSLMEEISDCRIKIVDIHAEATAEKLAMGFYLDGKATAVVGTHTHVQTADEKVLPGGTAYITDLGMTGPELSVLGVRPEASISWLKTGLPTRFEISSGACMMCGAIIDVDEKTGKSRSIERICVR